jgi:hypothetical protein
VTLQHSRGTAPRCCGTAQKQCGAAPRRRAVGQNRGAMCRHNAVARNYSALPTATLQNAVPTDCRKSHGTVEPRSAQVSLWHNVQQSVPHACRTWLGFGSDSSVAVRVRRVEPSVVESGFVASHAVFSSNGTHTHHTLTSELCRITSAIRHFGRDLATCT